MIKSNRTVEGIRSICEEGCESAQGLIGTDFEDYLVKIMKGEKSFSVEEREFDGRVGNRLDIAKRNNAIYELFSNTPIPEIVKEWLNRKGIIYTELLY